MPDTLDELRKAPRKVKDRFIATVTFTVMGVITIIWFFFTVSSFLKNGVTPPAPQAPAQAPAVNSPAVQAPFAQ